MRFTYIARTVAGEEQRGVIDAEALETAREMLRKRNLFIEEIHTSPSEERLTTTFTAPPVLPKKKSDPLWTDIDTEKKKAEVKALATEHTYVPLIDTFRLFAGWLLAWYAIVYLLGSAQALKQLPFEIPFIEGLFLSPLILRLTFATYLFLLFTTMHKAWGKGTGKGMILTLIGLALYAFFHVNV